MKLKSIFSGASDKSNGKRDENVGLKLRSVFSDYYRTSKAKEDDKKRRETRAPTVSTLVKPKKDGMSKKGVTWRNEDGTKTLENVRYVNKSGKMRAIGASERSGSKHLSKSDIERISLKRKVASVEEAKERVNQAKRHFAAYEGAMAIVKEKLRAEPKNEKRKFVVERAEKLLEEARIDLELALEAEKAAKRLYK